MEIKAEKREILGKKVAVLREKGMIPAELYGFEVPNMHLSIDSKAFEKTFKEAGENTVVNVVVSGSSYPVLIYDVQHSPVSGGVIAVDFYKVNMNKEIVAMIPLKFIGESKVVKEGLGIIVKAMDEIEIEALPADIPSSITVDISSLSSIGQSIYVKDLSVTGKFKFTVEPGNVVVSVSEKAAEEEVIKAEVTPDKVVVETEEKKAVRDAAKTDAGKGEVKAEGKGKGKNEAKA
jgi:large subunit ribosomal protein L25